MKKTCLLIPGNPAVASYYKAWMQEIEARNKHIHMVYATSYILFDKKLNYVEYDQAIRGHYENLLLRLDTPDKIIIIAHSVGSYFALKLLEKYPDKIEKVIILFPYIGYSDIQSLKFVSIPYFLDRFLPLVEIIAKFKNIFRKWDKEIPNISDSELTACLRFGVRECVFFNKNKFNIDHIIAGKEKITFLYKDHDRWCPKETIELLKPVSRYKRVDLPHDFITTPENRTRMTAEIADWLM